VGFLKGGGMKIKVCKKTEEWIDVDIELPIYRENDISGEWDSTVIYTRIDAANDRLREVSITVGSERAEIEIDSNYKLDSDADYTLGRGEYASSREAFEKAVQYLEAMLGRIKR
jgi:RNA polymerase subunit RPABC4/transcription elongation factor Spt4